MNEGIIDSQAHVVTCLHLFLSHSTCLCLPRIHGHTHGVFFLLCSLLLPSAMFPGLDEAEQLLADSAQARPPWLSHPHAVGVF